MVNHYTDTQPMELPTVQMSPAEISKLKERLKAFRKRYAHGIQRCHWP